jgi:hypothetical protein
MLVLAACLLTGTATAGDIKPGHPILGTWKITLPNGCSEVETYHYDGTVSATSGEETSEAIVEVADDPDASGAYEVVDTITETDGKKDCGGNITPVGDVATVYVHFSHAAEHMWICFDAACKRWFGPYERVAGV